MIDSSRHLLITVVLMLRASVAAEPETGVWTQIPDHPGLYIVAFLNERSTRQGRVWLMTIYPDKIKAPASQGEK